jgi:RNA methyltransferase, RsmE family
MKKISALKVEGDLVYLDKKHAYVLRISEGEKVKVLLPSGNFALVEVIDSDKMVGRILEFIKPIENKSKISVFISLLKKEKLEKVVEYLSIIGVERIVPVITHRCEVRPSYDKQFKIIERLKRISYENARISGVAPPKIENIFQIEKIRDEDYEKKIVFYEHSANPFSYEVLKGLISSKGKIAIFVGPEGGFSEEEISYLVENGWQDFSLGERIFTAELFPIYIISIFDFFSLNFST